MRGIPVNANGDDEVVPSVGFRCKSPDVSFLRFSACPSKNTPRCRREKQNLCTGFVGSIVQDECRSAIGHVHALYLTITAWPALKLPRYTGRYSMSAALKDDHSVLDRPPSRGSVGVCWMVKEIQRACAGVRQI